MTDSLFNIIEGSPHDIPQELCDIINEFVPNPTLLMHVCHIYKMFTLRCENRCVRLLKGDDVIFEIPDHDVSGLAGYDNHVVIMGNHINDGLWIGDLDAIDPRPDHVAFHDFDEVYCYQDYFIVADYQDFVGYMMNYNGKIITSFSMNKVCSARHCNSSSKIEAICIRLNDTCRLESNHIKVWNHANLIHDIDNNVGTILDDFKYGSNYVTIIQNEHAYTIKL